ncbi:MAG TPA: response regulator [Burkholderiales bacterium]|nr:response regulator [Burkholderiales bacterium]
MSTDLAQKCVLVVDDSKFVRTTFATILRQTFMVREAADGEAGWAAIEKDPAIVLVLADLDMPKLNGFALIGRIRDSSNRHIRELPVVVISGNEEQANKERAREAGATDFISKSADAAEVLSRLNNALRLVTTSRELEASRQAVSERATHDPVTGAFTPHYLVTEGRKHFAHAKRHAGELSIMALRVDSHADVVRAAGREIADVVLKRIAKLLMDKVRTEDSVARTAEAAFMVVAAGTAAPQMLALAQRLHRELEEAKVTYRGQELRFASRFGVASLTMDPVNSVEDLMRLAMHRLQSATGHRLLPEVSTPPLLPTDVERALQALENAADAGRLAAGAKAVMKRLQRIAKKLN